MFRQPVAAWKLALLSATTVVVINNSAFLSALFSRLPMLSFTGAAYLAMIVTLMIAVLFALFLAAGIGHLLKPLIVAVFVLSAVLGYFTNELGIVFGDDMIRNIMETVRDTNRAEAMELLSWSLFGHFLLFGVLPAVFLARVPLARLPLIAELRARSLCLLIACISISALVLPNYKYITYFSVENRDLRLKAVPIFALLSTVDYFEQQNRRKQYQYHVIGSDAEQHKSIPRRVIGVMVVGETARADHFSLNGYSRDTNPILEHEAGLMFFDAASCGTSTAYSVPCMFSMRGREDFSPDEAKQESNVLDILEYAGIRTVWIDNNSSCKGVCKRIIGKNLRSSVHPSSPFFNEGNYYDEILIGELDHYLNTYSSDLLIVLHTLGSHGPAYSLRYPRQFGIFRPYCNRKSPRECNDREVTNAYDNTIVYTDYFLGRVIEELRQRSDQTDSFMVYASDHGESLGEQGVYLHGLPYSLAPAAQTDVPMIVWLSPSLAMDYGIDTVSPSRHRPSRISHDYISHTLLGLFEVPTHLYKPELDLFSTRSNLYSHVK